MNSIYQRSTPVSKLYLATLLVLMLVFVGCSAQKSDQKTVAEKAPVIEDEGFELMLSDTLKTSGNTFLIAAYRTIGEDSISMGSFDELARPLLIYQLDGDNMRLIARNDNVILCSTCGGMMGEPFEAMDIEETYFTIAHSGGSSDRWTRNISFEYDSSRKGWYLLADQGVSYSSLDPEGTFEEVFYAPADSLGVTPFERFKTEF